jgi:hypothetical protein
MSLNWNIEKIVNYKQVCWVESDEKNEDGTPKVRLNPVTEALIFNAIAIDMGEITHDNASEVYARTRILENLNGPLMIRDGKPSPMTTEDIEAHVGLWCNVAFKNRADWAKRWFVGNSDYLMKHGTKFNSAKYEKDQEDFDVNIDQSLTAEFRRQFDRDRAKKSEELVTKILGRVGQKES